MRTFAFLGLFGAALAQPTIEEQGACIVNGGAAVSDAVDSALFIWAASKRCGKKGEMIKCEVDVSSSIKSINAMINVIVRTVDQCGALNTPRKKCGLAAGKLTQHSAGLTAQLGMLSQKCFTQDGNKGSGFKGVAAPVMCTIDLKDMAKNLFDSTNRFQTLKPNCEKGQMECAQNGLRAAGALAGLGQYLAGASGQCQRAANAGHKVTKENLCAQASLGLIEYLSKVANDALELSRECAVDLVEVEQQPPGFATGFQHRLYEGKTAEKNGFGFTLNLVLGALLPAAAVVGFVGGKSARYQSINTRELVLSDNE